MPNTVFKNALAELDRASKRWGKPIRGCDPEEISDLEQQFGVELPPTYRAFLAALGRSSSRFLVGSDFLIRHLKRDLQQGAREILEDEGEFPLPPVISYDLDPTQRPVFSRA